MRKVKGIKTFIKLLKNNLTYNNIRKIFNKINHNIKQDKIYHNCNFQLTKNIKID
jgi:hypothetical protein